MNIQICDRAARRAVGASIHTAFARVQCAMENDAVFFCDVSETVRVLCAFVVGVKLADDDMGALRCYMLIAMSFHLG